MFEAETEVVQLESRLGRVGSIQAWDPWKSRQSVAHAKWWVAKIASLSYGNDAAKNPAALFQSLVDREHHATLEFVPWNDIRMVSLPHASLRHRLPLIADPDTTGFWEQCFGERHVERGRKLNAATAFLVECPLYIRSQWMRHRSFSYLELSRRYTKGSKVEWEYYGESKADTIAQALMDDQLKWMRTVTKAPYEGRGNEFWRICEQEYLSRLAAGWPNEIARGCMPVEAMTKFWVAGFDRDWGAFLKLRDDDHAQPEIRAFASWISKYLAGKHNSGVLA